VLVLEISHHVLVVLEAQQLPVHIVLTVHLGLVHQQLVLQRVQVAVVHHNVAVQAEHLEKMRARNQDVNLNQEKHYVMNSTICRHHNLVEQSSHTVMARLLFVCDAVPHWQISPTRSMQIQQH